MPLVPWCSAGTFSTCSRNPLNSAVQHLFCFRRLQFFSHYKALVSVIFMHFLMSRKYLQTLVRPLSTGMNWSCSCHLKVKLLIPAGGNLCQLSPGVQQTLQCAPSQMIRSVARPDCIRGLHLNNTGVLLILMMVIISKTVEAHSLLNITARGLFEIRQPVTEQSSKEGQQSLFQASSWLYRFILYSKKNCSHFLKVQGKPILTLCANSV